MIGALVRSDTGDLLVQLFSASERPYDRFRYDASSRWLLLGEDGSAKMTFDLPRTFVPEVVRACSVYGVYTDSDNVQTVRRYDLAPVCRTREAATSPSTWPEAAPRLPANAQEGRTGRPLVASAFFLQISPSPSHPMASHRYKLPIPRRLSLAGSLLHPQGG